MATEPERWSGVSIPRDRPRGRAKVKPAKHEDYYLCVALVALLVWALVVGLRAVGW